MKQELLLSVHLGNSRKTDSPAAASRGFLQPVAAIALFAILSANAVAQCASGSLVVLVNKNNPSDSLSMAQLRKLMLGDVRNWPD